MDNVQAAFPIDHWSYSSSSLFMRNRLAFKKRYILKIYDSRFSPSSVVGSACHSAAAQLLRGGTPDQAIQAGLLYIHNQPDTGIDWGKTGNPEKLLKDFNQAFQFFLEYHPKYGKVLDVEKTLTEFVEYEGTTLALPLKCICDLVQENGKDLEVRDHKFVGNFTEPDGEDPMYFWQAMFNYFPVMKYYGRAPKRMVFDEYKTSKNKDGAGQHQEYVIEYGKHPHYFKAFINLLNELTAEIARPDCRYLPNFQDLFDGEASFTEYVQGLVDIETPIMVQHKTVPVQIVEKRYVESPSIAEGNKFLSPEEKVRMKLLEFGLPVQMEHTHQGASVTLYTMKPARGCKMSRFEQHAADLALALEAKTIRVQAPIPGTSLVGVEAPNREQATIPFSDAILAPGTLNLPIGVDVYGRAVAKALDAMPHLLVAGATGAGKSVFLNVAIRALSEQNTPSELQLVLIDPKKVELTQFKSLPHLLVPTITDEEKARKALAWLVEEMERRYGQLESAGCRNVTDYNAQTVEKMARTVVVIDEFADLILGDKMTARGRKRAESIKHAARKESAVQRAHQLAKEGISYRPDVEPEQEPNTEDLIVRLAQKARAVGIHLIIGTQRPSVDVVTGRIKANMPTRIAFMTASSTDSRVILDEAGAEQLIGKGDMLFLDPGTKGLQRLQGYYA